MSQFYPNTLLANRYLLVKKIGVGGFSEVWEVQDKMANDIPLAVKILLPNGGGTESIIEQFLNEYKATFRLHHPHLLKSLDLSRAGEHLFIVMPLCSKGSLENAIEKKQHFDEETIAKILYQLADALAYLHQQNIIHNDIKPANVLIDKNGKCVLSDFGISTQIKTTLYSYSQLNSASSASGLTVAYAAPEIFSENPVNLPPSDIFSLGMSMYELMAHSLPWKEQGGIALLHGAEIPHLPSQYSKKVDKLIRTCLDRYPQNRPTATELREAAKFYLQNGYWQSFEPVPPPSPIINPLQPTDIYEIPPTYSIRKPLMLASGFVALMLVLWGISSISWGTGTANQDNVAIDSTNTQNVSNDNKQPNRYENFPPSPSDEKEAIKPIPKDNSARKANAPSEKSEEVIPSKQEEQIVNPIPSDNQGDLTPKPKPSERKNADLPTPPNDKKGGELKPTPIPPKDKKNKTIQEDKADEGYVPKPHYDYPKRK